MMIALMAVYLVLLFAIVRLGIVPFNAFWKASPFIVLLLLNLQLFIPMGWGAPQGSALVVRNAVSIVPSVAGEVIDVLVQANTALKAGDILFKIDPTPFEAQVAAIEAQLKLSTTRLAQMTQLFERDSGRGFDVEQRQSEVDQLKAQLESAKWNLDKTVVRAGRRLRHQRRVAEGCPRRKSPAVAGDGLHRHVRHLGRCRNNPERRPLRQAGTSGRGDLQVRARRRPDRHGRDGLSGHLDGTNSGLRHGGRAEGDPVGAVRAPREAR
jgi:multidrug efflux pump subunit AcrA (membrane-fusion protein)